MIVLYTHVCTQTEAEIATVVEELCGAGQSLADKAPPMMVVQTRLESRTFRPGVELCRDPTQYSMVEEVAQIAQSQATLSNKLQVAQYVCVLYKCIEGISLV